MRFLFRALPPPPELGQPPEKAQGIGPQGPFVVTAILLIVGAVVLGNLANGSPSLAALNAAVITCSALILGGVFAKGIREAIKGSQRLDAIPDLPNPEDELHKTQQMRSRAAELRLPPGQRRTVAELPPPPASVSVEVPKPPRVITTVREIRENSLEDERLLRVAAILIVSCPLCGAPEAGLCEPVKDLEWYQLDKDRGLYAHSLRVIKAVSTGTAKLEDVSAQFNDNVPEQILGALI